MGWNVIKKMGRNMGCFLLEKDGVKDGVSTIEKDGVSTIEKDGVKHGVVT